MVPAGSLTWSGSLFLSGGRSGRCLPACRIQNKMSAAEDSGLRVQQAEAGLSIQGHLVCI